MRLIGHGIFTLIFMSTAGGIVGLLAWVFLLLGLGAVTSATAAGSILALLAIGVGWSVRRFMPDAADNAKSGRLGR